VTPEIEADEEAGAQLVSRQADDGDGLGGVDGSLNRQRILVADRIECGRHRDTTVVSGDADAGEALLEIPDEIVRLV
jgi:hypothetical protein